MKKNILITGSGGFIGKNLVDYLKDNYILFTPRSSELDVVDRQSVLDYFKNKKIDYIIHCATVGGLRGAEDPESTVVDNLAMVNNLIEAKDESAKIILFSSGAMYGKDRDLKKIQECELGKYEPKDAYGKSKMLIAQKIKDRKDVLCLNIFGCYGYGEREERFPTYAIIQNLKKTDIVINQNVVFDYLFIEDLQKIVGYFLTHESSENIINITPSQSISLVEIAESVNEISNFKSKIIVKNQNLNFEYTGSNSLLLKNYPELKFISYDEGLDKLYKYYEQSLSIKN